MKQKIHYCGVVAAYFLRYAFVLTMGWELLLAFVPATQQNLPGIYWHLGRVALMAGGWWFVDDDWQHLSMSYYRQYAPEELQ